MKTISVVITLGMIASPAAALWVPQTRQEFVKAVAAGARATKMETITVTRRFEDVFRLLQKKIPACLDVEVRRSGFVGNQMEVSSSDYNPMLSRVAGNKAEFTLQVVHRPRGVDTYLTISTALVFAVAGGVLGAQADRLRILSNTDPLTDVVNRRGFHDRLVEEIARVERYGTPAALLLIDLDGLKQINDRQGHRAGDAALCALASALRGCIREPDLVARVGGDEFVVLAPETKADEALALAGRIRDYLKRGTDAWPAFTVSIGVAGARQGDGRSAAEIFSHADEALYAAKRAGGDCAILAKRLAAASHHQGDTRRAPERQA